MRWPQRVRDERIHLVDLGDQPGQSLASDAVAAAAPGSPGMTFTDEPEIYIRGEL
jgi:hypothetical protein